MTPAEARAWRVVYERDGTLPDHAVRELLLTAETQLTPREVMQCMAAAELAFQTATEVTRVAH